MIKNQVLHLSSWPSLSNFSKEAVPDSNGNIYANRTLAPTGPALCGEYSADSHEPAVIPFISRLWERLTFSHAFA
jgi:hypothetical protein